MNRSLTWRRLLLTILVLWVLAGIVSLALTYAGRSHGVVRPPTHHPARR